MEFKWTDDTVKTILGEGEDPWDDVVIFFPNDSRAYAMVTWTDVVEPECSMGLDDWFDILVPRVFSREETEAYITRVLSALPPS